jgi:PKD repeat protein
MEVLKMAFKMQPAYLFLSLTLIAALLVAPASAAGGDTSGGILEAIVDWFLRWLPQPPAETTSGVPPPAATETQSLPQDPEPGSHAEMESPPQDQDPDPESTPDPEAIEAQPESRDPVLDPTPTPARVLGTVHTVDYRTVPPSGSAPLMVRFTAVESADFDTYAWDFGDGFSSTERDHFHTYTEPGTYTATLTVSNSVTGETTSAEMSIPVEPPGVVPLPTDTSLDPTPTPTSDPDTGSSGSNNAPLASPTVVPTPTPTGVLGTVHSVDYRTDPPYGSAPLMVRFTAVESADFGTYFWDFGDGFFSTERDHFHTYTDPGTYTATLTVSNSTTKWSSSAQMTIQVEPPGVVPLPTETDDPMTPVPTPTSEVTETPVPPTPDPTTPVPTVTEAPAEADPAPTPAQILGPVYAVDYRTDPPSGSAPLMVRFTAVESADFDAYIWDFGDGFSSTERNPFHTYTDIGTYTATLTVSNSVTGWNSTAEITVEVEPPGVVPLPTDEEGMMW